MSTNAASADGTSIIGSGEALPLSTSDIVTEAHVVEIKGYSLLKGLGNGEFIDSSTFYLCGHRWFLRYYPAGFKAKIADWVSLYLFHDNTDAVDFKAQLRFSVPDDIGEPVPMFSKKTTCAFSTSSRDWGYYRFVTRKDLEESSYLKVDCLKIRCDVIVSKDIPTTELTTQFVVVLPSNMHQDFGGLLSGAVGADVTFEVAGEIFAAHRCVLAARSSVFKASLFGPMKEKAMNCIRIQDMEASVFKTMLHFVYTDNVPDFDKGDESVITQHLLVAADRYDLERLKLICEDKLCKCIDTSTVAATLVLAELQGCHGLKKACLEFLKSPSHLKTVMVTESFDHLLTTCPSLVKELLAKMAACP